MIDPSSVMDPEQDQQALPQPDPNGIQWFTEQNRVPSPGADLRQSLSLGVQQDPDEYAKLMRQQQQTGMAPQVTQTQSKEIQQTLDVNNLNPEQMPATHPRTAAWASNVDNASVAGASEVERLKYIEAHAKTMADTSGLEGLTPGQRQAVLEDRMRRNLAGTGVGAEVGSAAASTDVAFMSPFKALVEAGGALVQGSLESLKPLFGSGDWSTVGSQLKDIWTQPRKMWIQEHVTDPVQNYFAQNILQGPQQYLKDPQTGQQFENPDYRWYGRPLATSVESVPGTMAAFALTGKLGAVGEGALGAEGAGVEHQFVPALLGTEAAQNTYAEAREKGADQKAAIIAALGSGITNYALMGQMPAPLPTTSIMGALGQWGARSAAMGTAMTVSDNAIARAYYDPDRGMFQGLPQSIATMAAFEGVGTGMDVLGKITDAVAESRLRTRAPAMFKSAMEQIFSGQQSIEVPAQDFITYYQSKGLDPVAEAAKAGVTNLEEAAAAGTNLEIPKDNFFGQVDPEHQKGLLPDIVDPQTGMTSRQMETRRAELKDWVEQAGPEKLAELTQQADEQTQASPEYQTLLNQMRLKYGQAGYAPDVAEHYATLHANWYMNLAREAGLKPEELMAMRMPMIVAGEAPGAGMAQANLEKRFVQAPSGDYHFGEITPDVAQAAGIAPGKIRLRQGDESSGLAHISERHWGDIQKRGFATIPDFVRFIGQNFNAIYRHEGGASGAYDFAVRDPKGALAIIRLEKDPDGDFWDVKTAHPVRERQFSGKTPLWERTGPSPPSTEVDLLGPRSQGSDELSVTPAESEDKQAPGKTLYQTLPSRWPTAAGMTPSVNEPMLADLDALKQNPTQLENAVNAVSEEPGMRSRARSTNGKLENMIERMKDNLIWLHNQMPEDIRERAKRWYEGAQRIASDWGERYGQTRAQVAGIMAVLSPQKDWFMNASLGERILDIMSTQMDHVFDEKMHSAAFRFLIEDYNEKRDKKGNIIPPENLPAYEAVKDKSLREVVAGGDLRQIGLWIRAYDEAHHSAGHAVIHPEGALGENVTTAKGEEASRAWGGFDAIGKAASIFLDGSPENISKQLGGKHKVRNFYNNIYDATDPRFTTIDTHAVAAALLRPLAGSDKAVMDNFGTTGGAKATGVSGSYPIYYEAYKRAAEELGILPREMQSITWEAVRGLFTPEFKSDQSNKAAIDDIWKQVDRGRLSVDDARQQISEMSGGINDPAWVQNEGEDATLRDKTYTQERPPFAGRKVTFEVAPDPNNAAQVERWNKLEPEQRWAISKAVGWEISGRALAALKAKGELHAQLGGYLDSTNPSLSLWLDDNVSASKMLDLARVLGYALDQDSMMVTSPASFKGGSDFGTVLIHGVTADNAASVYNELRDNVRADDGSALINGHTTADGTMAILVDANAAEDIYNRVADHLANVDGDYSAGKGTIQAAWPEKGEDSYGLQETGRSERTGVSGEALPQSPLRALADQLRGQASSRLEQHLQDIEGGALYQRRGDQPRGWFRERPDGSFEIGRTRISDLSTLIHEPAHSYLELFRSLSQRDGASEQIKNDFQKICEWLGTTPEEVLRNGFTRDQHEQWARGNELYVREGKAPSKGLRAVFQRFGIWLQSVYKKADELGVELSPEVREVMDRYYASEEGVNNAQEESAPKAFNSPEEAGWTEAQYQKYAEAHGMEVDEAKQKILGLMNEASLRERTDAWQAEERNVREAQTAAVDASPAYTAIRSLRRGALDDGTEITLNRDAMVEQFGEDRVKALQKQHPGLYRNEGGTDAQGAAEALGYTSGEEMLRALESSPRRADAIEQATRDYMTQKHGDVRYDGSLQDKARLALANDQRAERLHTELEALAGRNTPEGQLREAQRQLREAQKTEETEAKQQGRLTKRDERIEKLKAQIAELKAKIAADRAKQTEGRKLLRTIPPIEAFRAAAKEAIAGKRVADLQPMRYLDASRKFGSEAMRALARGDYEAAKDAKQKELLNHFLYREAAEAKEYIGKVEKDVQRFNSKGIQQKLGKAGQDYLAHFNNLLTRYGFRPGNPQALGLAQWAQGLYDAGKEPAIDPRLMDESRALNYKDASVEEVRAVHDALKNIRKMAYQELGMIVHGRRVEFDSAISELVDAARTNLTARPRPVLKENVTFGQERRDLVGRGAALLARMEFVIKRLDGGLTGPWHDYLWRLAADSQGAEASLNHEVTKAIGDALERMPKEQRKQLLDKVTVPGIAEPIARRTLIAMALNMGNESNLDRLTKTFEFHNWDPRAIEAVKTALTREEWTFVQDAWNTLEGLGKKAFDFETRMNGIPPVKIHAAPFDVQLADGTSMHLEGGYYPSAYDPDYSLRPQQGDTAQTAQNLMEGGYGRATTSKSYTKERTGFGGPLLLDYEQVLTQHTAKVIKDITHREFMLAANKIVTHPDIRRALMETMGPGYEKQFIPWLKTIVNDRNGSAVQGLNDVSKGMNFLRTNVVKAALGLKFNTMLLQLTHASSMLLYTSPKSYSQALIDFLAHPVEMTRQIHELSPNEMAMRGENLDRDMRKVLQDKGHNVADIWARLGMAPVRFMDHLLSFPFWLAVHRDTLAKLTDLPEEEAKYQAMHAADAAVRMGLGSSAPKDIAPVMRNSDLTKFLTTMGGFHNLKWNQISDVATTFGQELNPLHLTYGMVMASIAPALLGAWISGRGPDKDENVGVWAAKRALLFPAETMALINIAVEAFENKGDVRLNPVVSMIERAAKAGYKLGTARRPDRTGIAMDLTQSGMEAAGVSGTDQLFKTLHYLRQAQQGKIRNPNVWGAITGASAPRRR